jgi:hypothetical protein
MFHSKFTILTSKFLAGAILLLAGVVAVLAQDSFFGMGRPLEIYPNIEYDGRFTFVRVKYTTAPGGFWYGGWPAWAHGYPVSEQNLMHILDEVSLINGHVDEINTLTLDDPELFNYPVAYLIEVGWWTLTDSEAAALRAYLQKGGFVIVDDFKVRGWGGGLGGGGWEAFERNMRRVLPKAKFVDLDATHPIFHSFFEVPSLDVVPQAYNAGRPLFRGVFEDNDPARRLQMIINYNTDVSQFWEWTGTGLRPLGESNEAYKLGVNYVVYGMTH